MSVLRCRGRETAPRSSSRMAATRPLMSTESWTCGRCRSTAVSPTGSPTAPRPGRSPSCRPREIASLPTGASLVIPCATPGSCFSIPRRVTRPRSRPISTVGVPSSRRPVCSSTVIASGTRSRIGGSTAVMQARQRRCCQETEWSRVSTSATARSRTPTCCRPARSVSWCATSRAATSASWLRTRSRSPRAFPRSCT